MEIKAKATPLEQSRVLYNYSDNEIKYWKDWAEKLIEFCINEMGWEVECGPGTSLGVLLTRGTYQGYYTNPDDSSCWDCDWTQPNGLVERVKDTTNPAPGGHIRGYPLYTGWFYEFSTWPEDLDKNLLEKGITGIGETGRFDFIIYVGENKVGEKIGIRVKYPVCSVGYSTVDSDNDVEDREGNYIIGTPVFTLYSNLKGNIELTIPSTYSYKDNIYTSTQVRGFARYLTKEGLNSELTSWEQSDITNSYQRAMEKQQSAKWSLEYQISVDYTVSVFGSKTTLPNRSFNNYWKKYNKIHYHFSENKDTVYFYITDNINSSVGIKFIVTYLENGECAILMEGRYKTNSNILAEVIAITGENNNYLIKSPTRPYTKLSSGTNRFSFSRLLIPTQNVLTKNLFYVTKKDLDETIQYGQYVYVKDKYSQKHYFRVIPFGSNTSAETSNDNTTYLAFPIVAPNTEEEEDVTT